MVRLYAIKFNKYKNRANVKMWQVQMIRDTNLEFEINLKSYFIV